MPEDLAILRREGDFERRSQPILATVLYARCNVCACDATSCTTAELCDGWSCEGGSNSQGSRLNTNRGNFRFERRWGLLWTR